MLLSGALDPDFLTRLFTGTDVGPVGRACDAAGTFAGQNGATVTGCTSLGGGRWGFTVGVVTQNTVGKSVVPGTENVKATATATAVVEPRCGFTPSGTASSPAQPPPGGAPTSPPADQKPPTPVSPGSLSCPGKGDITIDPEHLDLLPDMADLFTVRLVDNPS
jgi:hypothetical protein